MAEIALLASVQSGTATLDFDAAVRRHQSMVYSLALRFLRDHGVAEELAQEVFLELHRHRNRIQSDAHLTHWLRQVTSRRCIDQARRRKVRAQIALEDTAELPAWAPAGGDPTLKRYVEQLLQKLEEGPRMMVILRYQEDLQPSEIAELLDMPVGTVKSQLHRALSLLREKMSRMPGGSEA
ncbi:MAG: sigma-70 family RNA polymerase sigma factor [Acidobacteriota bacterium]|nr:sigma-70 family RNA polymerase sigma factor [Acidobacteriota bacterium]